MHAEADTEQTEARDLAAAQGEQLDAELPDSAGEVEEDEIDEFDGEDGQDARHERDGSVFLPSPEEIRASCEEIQKGWTALDRHHRNAFKTRPIEYDNHLKPGRAFGV